jgi:hypothetical protein
MYPIDTGSPVELRLSKFIFGWFTVMLLGFMATQRNNQLKILGAGFAAVSVWMFVDQLVLGQLDSFAAHYYHEASTFFNQPDVLDRWKANLILATKVSMVGMVVAMVIIMLGVWKIRSFSLLLALVPAMLALVLRPQHASLGRLHGQALHAHGVRRGQGGAVLHLLLSLLGLRTPVDCFRLPDDGAAAAPQADAQLAGELRAP